MIVMWHMKIVILPVLGQGQHLELFWPVPTLASPFHQQPPASLWEWLNLGNADSPSPEQLSPAHLSIWLEASIAFEEFAAAEHSFARNWKLLVTNVFCSYCPAGLWKRPLVLFKLWENMRKIKFTIARGTISGTACICVWCRCCRHASTSHLETLSPLLSSPLSSSLSCCRPLLYSWRHLTKAEVYNSSPLTSGMFGFVQ